MNFQTATDLYLKAGGTLQEVADALDVSLASVKQARLDPSTPSYRTPPGEWEQAMKELLRQKEQRLAEIRVRLQEGW